LKKKKAENTFRPLPVPDHDPGPRPDPGPEPDPKSAFYRHPFLIIRPTKVTKERSVCFLSIKLAKLMAKHFDIAKIRKYARAYSRARTKAFHDTEKAIKSK
jgi:hypothetical protein